MYDVYIYIHTYIQMHSLSLSLYVYIYKATGCSPNERLSRENRFKFKKHNSQMM